MGNTLSDIRHAFRALVGNPGITAVAMISLALGLGPNAAIFSVIDAIGFHPLAISDPERLVRLYTGTATYLRDRTSYPDFSDIRDHSRQLSQIAAWNMNGVGVSGGGRAPEIVMMTTVSGSFFPLLGIKQQSGRLFLPDEVQEGHAAPVVLISDAYWSRRYGRSPQAIDSAIRLNNIDYTIVGVLPATFEGVDYYLRSDIWMPFGAEPSGQNSRLGRDRRTLGVVARLRDGVTLGQAQSELNALATELEKTHPATNKDRRITIEFEAAARRLRLAPIAVALLLIPCLVLLIACANVAGLLLGRGESRRAEIAVRLAVGASRLRLVRQLLTESAVLGVIAGGFGLLLGYWIINLLPALIPSMPIPIGIAFRLNLRVAAWTFAAGLLAVPVFGLAPALFASKPEIVPLLKAVAGTSNRFRRLTLRNVLTVGQIAVSLVLLILSGLLVRSFLNSGRIDAGFVPKPMIICTMAPGIAGYSSAQTDQFYRQFLGRLTSLPSVESATIARHMPLNTLYGGGRGSKVLIPDQPPAPGVDGHSIMNNIVQENYFATMGTRIVHGRAFSAADRWPGIGVVLVNQTMARRFWPNEDPIGKWIELADRTEPERRRCQIIGVVQDAKYMTLSESQIPYFYVPYGQQPAGEMTVIVRVRGDEAAAIEDFRNTLRALDPALPTLQIITLREHMRLALIVERISAILVGTLGTLALVLSVVGLYGVISYLVARRTREIGIRMALGARPMDVLIEVLKQGGGYALTGMGLGLALMFLIARIVRSVLYEINSYDPPTYIATCTMVLAITLLATYLPARRAARIDPIRALRCE